MIRVRLAVELEAGRVQAIGGFIDADLVGVAAWSEVGEIPVWTCAVVAVAEGHTGHGVGALLKGTVIRVADAAGVREVRSIVHRDNVPMVAVNKSLGAAIAPDPDDRLREHLVCVIRLPLGSEGTTG